MVDLSSGILVSLKKNEIKPFVATWIDLEIIMLSATNQTEISYDIAYIWNLKNYTNELLYKTEINSQT